MNPNDDIGDNEASHIQVAVRIRPAENSSFSSSSSHGILHAMSNPPSVHLGSPPTKSFYFDLSFPPNASQKSIYEDAIQPLVKECIQGYNATVLAYGQTGSGKTYTMMGPSNTIWMSHPQNHDSSTTTGGVSSSKAMDVSQAGVIPRAIRDLFQSLKNQQQEVHNKDSRYEYRYSFQIQFLELYGEAIHDLLSPSSKSQARLVIRDGTQTVEPEVIGATQITVTSPEEALMYMSKGMLRRITGSTAMNCESSRSHAIFTLMVEQHVAMNWERDTGIESLAEGPLHSEVESKRSKFHFVDLAGSERQKKSLATGIRLKEGIDINKGLLALGNVISALGDPVKKGQHVPYRDSKLTRLLKGSLGGNHKTLMIACVSPIESNFEESLNTLRYANRAKNIQNKAILNVDSSSGSKLVKILKYRIHELAEALLAYVSREETNGNIDGKSQGEIRVFTVSELQKLSRGEEINSIPVFSNISNEDGSATNTADTTVASASSAFHPVGGLKAELDKLKSVIEQLQSELKVKSEELFAAKVEAEYYRLQLVDDSDSVGKDKNKNESKTLDKNPVLLARMRDYEKEIEFLRGEIRKSNANSICNQYSKAECVVDGSTLVKELCRERSLSDGTEDSEISVLTKKYIKMATRENASQEDGSISDKNDDDDTHIRSNDSVNVEEEFRNRQAQLNNHMTQLSSSILAKEELLIQLERSKAKYMRMKAFYEDKLKKMSLQLSIQEAEKTSLETELQKYTKNSQKYLDLEQAVAEKEKHIAKIKKRQSEMKELTSVATRNEMLINSLNCEIRQMKNKRDELQRQIKKERLSHNMKIRQLEKKMMSQEQDNSKMRQQLVHVTLQKQRVEHMAHSRGEEIAKLRAQYKDSEKRLRMQTLKKGMLKMAGIEPVMIGMNSKKWTDSNSVSVENSDKQEKLSRDLDQMRIILSKKVEEVSRKESTAEVVAKEWEDHFALSSRRDIALAALNKNPIDSQLQDEIDDLEVQIHFKESRIRQLATKLGKPDDKNPITEIKSDTLIQDIEMTSAFKDQSPTSLSNMAASVLFGMVVRERRRVLSLARTASNLDQLNIEASRRAEENEKALKAVIEESRNERVSLVQNHQEKILSLMEIIQDDESIRKNANEEYDNKLFSGDLQIAYERIQTLEDQLDEMENERMAREKLQVQKEELNLELMTMNTEYKHLFEKMNRLQSVLIYTRQQLKLSANPSNEIPSGSNLLDVIESALSDHPISEDALNRGKILSKHDYDLDYDDENNGFDIPEWTSSIMQDLEIIAAGNIPRSMQAGAENVKVRKSFKPSSVTVDEQSVSSNRSFSTPRSSSLTRYETPSKSSVSSKQRSISSPRLDEELDFSPQRKHLPDRISNILKDGPVIGNGISTIEDDESMGTKSATSSHGNRSSKRHKDKDVFQRLQKQHTNSFTNRRSLNKD